MKNCVFSITLFMGICFSVSALHASDHNSTLSDVDKNIFTVDGRIASPYKTEFVASLSYAFIVIESDPIKPLCDNALERTSGKSMMTCNDFENTDWGPHMSKVMNDRRFLDKLPTFIHHVTASSVDITKAHIAKKVVDNTLIMIPEYALFTLLQYTYGIKRITENSAEFLLTVDGSKTIPAKSLLMKIVNKYRKHEQQASGTEVQQNQENQANSATSTHEGGLFYGQ